ncbi:hypothetical protein NMG60_11019329 [Bertholletia excelsa]
MDKKDDLAYQQILLSGDCLNSKVDDDFSYESFASNEVFQVQQLGNFSLTRSPENTGFRSGADLFEPYDPFAGGDPPSFEDLYKFTTFGENEEENSDDREAMQNSNDGGGGGGRRGLADVTSEESSTPLPLNCVVPDEGPSDQSAENSGSGAEDGRKKGGGYKTKPLPLPLPAAEIKQARVRKRASKAKGQWTLEEDRLLIRLVETYGMRKWSHIAQMLKGRIGKQCRERWHNHLRPDIKKENWTEEEDRILIQAHALVGNKWAEIAKHLPGRTENAIKNHWNATKRRQYSRRKCRSKFPRPSSILQNYIKNLHLDGNGTNDDNPVDRPTIAAELIAITAPPPLLPRPKYGFEDVVPFEENNIMFEDDGGIGSLQIPDMEIGVDLDPDLLMDGEEREVEKDVDLMEMITQVNNSVTP